MLRDPLRGYVLAGMFVSASVAVRAILTPWFSGNVPYLLLFPAVLLAAWQGGFGPGTLATALSVLAAMYLYLPPAGFAINGAGDWFSLALFTLTALSISWLNHRVKAAETAHRAAAALANARAERLDTILNTAVDGIIVINDRGLIERFNRGAERLFGYPETEVVGRNVSMLMPAPYHRSTTDTCSSTCGRGTPKSSAPAAK
jgi:two-component system sensor kinase FixL